MTDIYTHILDLAALVSDVPADSILSRTILDAPDTRAVMFRFAAGQELSEHTAAMPAILHFISGTAKLILGGEPQDARPGAWVHMPARMPHSVYAETEVIMLLLLIKASAES